MNSLTCLRRGKRRPLSARQGGWPTRVKVRDVVMGLSAYTNSNFGRQLGFDGNVAPCCSFKLLEQAVAAARKMGHRADRRPAVFLRYFLRRKCGMSGKLKKLGVLAVEMESASLYLKRGARGQGARWPGAARFRITSARANRSTRRRASRPSPQMMEIALSRSRERTTPSAEPNFYFRPNIARYVRHRPLGRNRAGQAGL